ncbi:TPA: hypothetical protein ACT92K_003546 [Enterobacter roggenkampii]
MKLTLKEMNGLLNGKCLPSDLIVGETLAEYLVRKFAELDQKLADSQREFRAADATIENLQMQVEKLAAKNAGLKAALNPEVIPEAAVEAFTETVIMDHDWNETSEWSWVENDTDVIRAVLEAIKPETPDTDAFLAEVRAQGVEMFAASLGSPYVERGEECYQDGYTHAIERIKCRKAPEFAAQLRKGVQS